jgi:hypothetical protein
MYSEELKDFISRKEYDSKAYIEKWQKIKQDALKQVDEADKEIKKAEAELEALQKDKAKLET